MQYILQTKLQTICSVLTAQNNSLLTTTG